MSEVWPSRWTACRLDPRQHAFLQSTAMMNVVPAGRRSWKTEGSKRRLVRNAVTFHRYPDGRFYAGAPTHQQAKDIFWDDLKAMVPRWALATGNPKNDISDGELKIRLWNGAMIKVVGLDVPARIEGKDWDGGVVDEYADCKKSVLEEHILPMLVRGGYVDVIGVPGGRNHYFELVEKVRAGIIPDAAYFHWTAKEVLHLYLGHDRADTFLAQMREQMDEMTFEQEFNASFIVFEGRVYYAFRRELHAGERVRYDPALTLVLAFDFNVSPGVCVILQEQEYKGGNPKIGERVTACVDEIWIARNSNTKRVCREILERYGKHAGEVHCYGDATGGAKGTARVEGSDWDLIKTALQPVFGPRLRFEVPKGNPYERVRVNAVNARIENADEVAHLLVDPRKCRHTIMDFEGVLCTPDGSGSIEKTRDLMLTHLTDAIGYYICKKYPLVEYETILQQM